MATENTGLWQKFQMAEKAFLEHHHSCENCGAEGDPKAGPSISCAVGQELGDIMDHYGLELQDSPEGLMGFCSQCKTPGQRTGEDLRREGADVCAKCRKANRAKPGVSKRMVWR